MGFLNFMVETYERHIRQGGGNVVEANNDEDSNEFSNESGRYLSDHHKSATHSRVFRSENHTFLPNIIGPWVPRRDVEGVAKCYYYAAMLALLKPWRKLEELKVDSESWQATFETFIHEANQRDKDVVSGCQYYYESKSEGTKNEMYDEREIAMDASHDDEMMVDDDDHDGSVNLLVSNDFTIKTI